jgi:hypothetical protein
MTRRRKRDDLETGELYRVVQRAAGSQDEWVHSSYGTYGKPRTYMTLSAARSQRTAFERAHRQHLAHRILIGRIGELERLEFAVQRAPITVWEIVPDGTHVGTRNSTSHPPER